MENKITKEEIDKIIVNKYNSVYQDNIKSVTEILDILSESFQEHYDILSDAQDAYNATDDDFKEIMSECCFVYSLSGSENWNISTGFDYDESQLSNYIKIVRENYNDANIKTLDDILDKIERQVEKTMSNVGCDMYNALTMILDEDLCYLSDKNIFCISGANCEGRIEILY